MSELKVYRTTLKLPEGKILNAEVYRKSEADKVIAELKQKLNEAQTELELWRDGSIISEVHQKELDEKRHSDYRRCQAMAEMCNARYDEEDAKVNGCGASWEYISKEMKYWERWRWRWDALADKFNPSEKR